MGTNQLSDQKAVDKVVYLASLASDFKSVDPLLDKLRFITARNSTVFSQQDRNTVQQLQEELENYLITKERAGYFTKASLQSRLEKWSAQEDPHKAARRTVQKQLVGVLSLPFLAYSFLYLILSANGASRVLLALPGFLLTFYIGLAWFFWTGRKVLVPVLQRSFALLVAGVVLNGFIGVQYPFLVAYPGVAAQPLFLYQGFILPFVLVFFLYYATFYVYAKQVNAIQTQWLRPTWILLAGAALFILVALLPHAHPVTYEIYFDLAVAAVVVGAFFCIAGAVAGFAIVRKITKRYARGVGYFAVSLLVYALSNIILGAVIFATGDTPIGSDKASGIFLLTGFLYMPVIVLQFIAAYNIKLNAEA